MCGLGVRTDVTQEEKEGQQRDPVVPAPDDECAIHLSLAIFVRVPWFSVKGGRRTMKASEIQVTTLYMLVLNMLANERRSA